MHVCVCVQAAESWAMWTLFGAGGQVVGVKKSLMAADLQGIVCMH